MKKTIHILLLFLLSGFCSSAQNQDSINYDLNSYLNVRSSDRISEFLNDDDFNYNRSEIKAPKSSMEKFLSWLADFFRFIDRGGKPVSYVFYALLFGVLLYVIFKLFGINYQTLFIRSSKIKSPETVIFDEDIHVIDFNRIIKDAELNQNYRVAIRYLYIQFLKTLSDKELIEWEINKTNKDYRREMKRTKYFKRFKSLTYVYEYVWYGEFQINETRYRNFKENFQTVYKEL